MNHMRQAKSQLMNRHKIITELKKAQRDGRLKGVHGRLGDLGIIDDKYDIAVSTACGYLDFIVVDTIKIGEECINYLREHRLGRASFICLDKVSQQVSALRSQEFRCPENAVRLFDLIQPSQEKFKDAFFFALKNTLVCQEINSATHTAYNLERRHRVVTLQGELIELSGTIAGGGRPRSGGMSSKLVEEFSDAQIEECDLELRKKKDEKLQVHNSLNELNNMYSDINHRKLAKHRDMEKANIEQRTYDEFLKDAERKHEKLSAEQE